MLPYLMLTHTHTHRTHLDDLVRLLTLVDHVQLSAAAALVVADPDGHGSGLQALVAVALGSTPLIDILNLEIE